jgi:hypothetical protein
MLCSRNVQRAEIRSLALTLDPCEHGVSIDFTLQIALLAASRREELVSVS